MGTVSMILAGFISSADSQREVRDDLRKRRSGTSSYTPLGYPNGGAWACHRGVWRQGCDLTVSRVRPETFGLTLAPVALIVCTRRDQNPASGRDTFAARDRHWPGVTDRQRTASTTASGMGLVTA